MANNIQKALECLDNRGKYQKILMIILILIYIELGFILLGAPFYYMNPIFKCKDADSDKYIETPENQACNKLQQCFIQNDFTVTYYANLTCENQSQRNLIQSAPYIGSIIGLLVLTPFSNEKGTKKIFMLGYLIAITGVCLNLIGAFAKVSVLMIGGQLIMGVGCYTYLILGYVLVSELMQENFKQKSIIVLNAVWAIAEVFIFVFYFWANDWKIFLVFVLVIPNIALLISGFFFFVQSPFYSIEKQRSLENAMQNLRKIASFNQSTEQQIKNAQNYLIIALEQINTKERQNSEQVKQDSFKTRFAIFRDWKYLKILLTVAVIEFGLNLYYYGTQFSLGQIGTNFGYNILMTGSIQFCAYLSSNLFITKIPRRLGMFIFNIIIIALGLMFLVDFQSNVTKTILLGICRFFNTYSLSILPMMQNQPFPYKYRAMAWGYIQGISQIGNFVTPYIVTICENSSINPLIVISLVIVVIGTLPLLNYPETLGKGEAVDEQEQDLKLSLRTQVQQSLINSQDKHVD